MGQNLSKRGQGSEEKPFDRVSGPFAVRSKPKDSEVLHYGNQPDRPGPEESVEFLRPSCEPNGSSSNTRIHESDDHDDKDLLVSERVRVTPLLLDRVGGYDELCKMLLQNKSLREVEWVINEANSCRDLCNLLKVHQTITSLTVHMGWINGFAARALSETLKTNTTITSLSLHGKWSDPSTAAALSDALKTNTTIISLSLHWECIHHDSVFQELSEAMKRNTTITSLTLQGKWIDDSAAYVLSKALQTNTTITSLTLHGEWFNGSAVYKLSEALKTNTTIVSLTLHGERIEGSAAYILSEALKTNTTITSLTLHGEWSDHCAAAALTKALKTNKTITSLSLHGKCRDRSVAAALSEALIMNTTITALTLHGTWNDPLAVDALSEALKTNKTITSLTLHGKWNNTFAARGLSEALKTNKTITSLTLHGEWSDCSAATALTEALKTNTTITSLSLHGKWSDDSGATALSEALITNKTITHLTLYGDWSDPSTADALSEALRTKANIISLGFYAKWSDPSAAAALIETLKTNKTIFLLSIQGEWSNRSAATSFAESLKMNTNKVGLILEGNWSDHSAVSAIAKTLKTNASINHVILHGKWSDRSAAAALLETLKTYRERIVLQLYGDLSDRSTLAALSNTFIVTKIDDLGVCLEGDWSDHSVAAALSEILKTNTSITAVGLISVPSDPCVAAAVVKPLKMNTTITALTLPGNWSNRSASDALSETLMTNKTITALHLAGTWNDHSAAAALSEVLKTNTTIEKLTLQGKWNDRSAAAALSETLKMNTTITALELHGNWSDPSAAAALLEILKTNTTITRVDLFGNWSDHSAAAALSKTFITNKRDNALTLWGNFSDHSSAAALSETLKTNKTITSLTLDGTWSDRSVAATLSETLKTNTTITSLTLHVTWSDLFVASALSEALKTNTTITSLTLHGNWSDPSAAAVLSLTLKTNTNITSLTLHGKWSDHFAVRALSEALKTNTTITSLILHGEWCGLDIAAAVSEALETNTTITSLTLLGKWSYPSGSAAVFSKVLRKGLTITLDKDYCMVVGATVQSYPRCLWISELETTDDSGIACKQEKGCSKALRNEKAKTCLEPLYIECSECSFELFTALRNECCQWSGVLGCEGIVLSTDYFTLAIRDEKLFYVHIGWHSNFIKIILETQADSVSTELCKTLSGGIRQFLETILELLRTKFQTIAKVSCVFKVESSGESSKCNIHNLQGCLDENYVQLSPIGWGSETPSRNWSYRNEEKKDAPTPADLFRLSLDLGHQWTTLGKHLGLAESVQTLLEQDKSEDQLKCFKLLMMWLKLGYSVTFDTLGKALVKMERDDLFFKHCKEEKQLSKCFTITPQGGQVSYLGCTIDIPEGSVDSEAELCLGFLKTGPPEGDCVAPVLHVKTKPSNLCLKKPVTVTLPVFVSPVEHDESPQPELTLMCFQEGLWKEVSSPKLSFSQTSFEVTHFGAWTPIVKNSRAHYHKDIACYLLGKDIPDTNLLDMRMCVCGNAEPEKQRLQEVYKDLDFVKLVDGENNFVVSRGCDVVLSSNIEPPDGALTPARVTPDRMIFERKNFENELVMQVAHFKVQMMPPIPSETMVVCLAGEGIAPSKICTRLQFNLKNYEKKQIADKEKKRITSNGNASGSSDGTNEEFGKVVNFVEELQRATASKKLKVVLLCDEWGYSKGGLSTFNRQLADNLSKQSDLKVFCYLPEIFDRDKSAAIKDNVTLVQAEDIPGNRDPLLKLHRWPSQWPSPDVIISHGRKFGSAAFFIKDRCPSCKWVHFVHENYEEMGRYKVGDNEMKRCNEIDADEMSCCRSADVVVAVGPQLLDRCRRSLFIERNQLQVFYPGLSKEFQNLSQKTSDGNEFHVYTFCSCSSEDFELKGVDLLADAVGRLGKKYKVHVLDVPEDEEAKIFQHALEKYPVRKHQLYVRDYRDTREELERVMYEPDLVVMPSRAEGFGLIELEALSAGVPLLVSAASGFGMTLKELDFGGVCVVESDDPQEWADRIELVKEKERSQRNEQMKQLRDQYEEKYKWEEQCSKLATFFRDECVG